MKTPGLPATEFRSVHIYDEIGKYCQLLVEYELKKRIAKKYLTAADLKHCPQPGVYMTYRKIAM